MYLARYKTSHLPVLAVAMDAVMMMKLHGNAVSNAGICKEIPRSSMDPLTKPLLGGPLMNGGLKGSVTQPVRVFTLLNKLLTKQSIWYGMTLPFSDSFFSEK